MWALSCFHEPSAGCTRAWLIYTFVCPELKQDVVSNFVFSLTRTHGRHLLIRGGKLLGLLKT